MYVSSFAAIAALRPRRCYEREHGVEEPAAEDARHRNREHNVGERLKNVRDTHEQGVRPPAIVAGEKSDETAERRGGEHDKERRENRRAPAREDARENIPAVVVRAEEMLSRGRREDELRICLVWIVGNELPCKERGEEDERTDERADAKCRRQMFYH